MSKRVLGIDIGMKRTGLAISDELGLSVRPLPNRIPKSRISDVEFIIALAQEQEVGAIVVGYPIMPRSGDEGPMAIRARGFKEALQAAILAINAPIVVELLEECYTSKGALKRLVDSGIKKAKRKEMLDSEVARMLVEEYLEAQNSTDRRE